MNQYKAIIFDWDGTLVDTCGLILDAHNHVRQHFNKPLWTMDDFLGSASKSAREYYPEIYGDDADQAQAVLYDFVEEHHLNYLKPMDGAIDLVKSIDLPVGIVSNKRHKTLMLEIEHLGVAGYFDCIVGAGVADKDKPSADPLLKGIQDICQDLSPDDILYVGDTETDLLCAKNTKCDIAFIQSEGERPDLVEKYTPQYEFMTIKGFYSCWQAQKNEKTSKIA